MNLEIELKAQDIAEALATMYGVDQNDVEVNTEKESRGYGLAEHDAYIPVARIRIKDQEVIRKMMEAAKEGNHD